MRNVQYSAAEDPVQGSGALRAAAVAPPAPEELEVAGGGMAVGTATALAEPGYAEGEEIINTPVQVEKTPGRNEPCYCGSGKKYKLCHGR